jgi:hypothetical protein
MSDSDRPLIIGSGTKHSVSVSEHTGNANSPKNKVHSDTEKKAEKAAVNEKRELAGKTKVIAEQRQDQQLDENLIVKAAISENIQTATKGINTDNSQKIEGEALNKLSAQELNNSAANEILDGIYKTSSALDQNVKVNLESIKENIQAINSDINSENIQEISFDKAIEPNDIKLSGEFETKNKAKILTDKDVDNLQKVPKDKESVNIQALPNEGKSSSDSQVLSNKSNKNIAQIEGVNDITKFHTPTEPRGVDNRQPIVKVEREENRQLIDTPHSEPYIQPKVEIKIPEENKQLVAKEGVQDHTERLPTEKTERSNSDISAAPIQTDLPISKVKPSNPQVFKNDEKLAEIKAKVEAINSEMANVNSQLDALGPIKEIPMQSLREKQHEAFLGRVARMKGDVASVNQQLNVLEDMAGLKSKRTG